MTNPLHLGRLLEPRPLDALGALKGDGGAGEGLQPGPFPALVEEDPRGGEALCGGEGHRLGRGGTRQEGQVQREREVEALGPWLGDLVAVEDAKKTATRASKELFYRECAEGAKRWFQSLWRKRVVSSLKKKGAPIPPSTADPAIPDPASE